MTTIPVWETMNKHKLMMKTHSHFVWIEYMVFYLVAGFVQQVT